MGLLYFNIKNTDKNIKIYMILALRLKKFIYFYINLHRFLFIENMLLKKYVINNIYKTKMDLETTSTIDISYNNILLILFALSS